MTSMGLGTALSPAHGSPCCPLPSLLPVALPFGTPNTPAVGTHLSHGDPEPDALAGPLQVPPPKVDPLGSHPQLKGVVLKTMIRKPKKPNSANRKCARVWLRNGKEVVCFIPGEGHNLQEHNIVLVEGGRTQDLPGVKLKVVRDKYNCAHVQKKKQ